MGNPKDFHDQTVSVKVGENRSLTALLYSLSEALYSRSEYELKRGTFRVKGDTVDIGLAGSDRGVRIEFFGDEIDRICEFDVLTGEVKTALQHIAIFPASHYVVSPEGMAAATEAILKRIGRFSGSFSRILRTFRRLRP